VKGDRLKFDDESRALYDAVAPTHPESHFEGILQKLETKIPGEGPSHAALRRMAASASSSQRKNSTPSSSWRSRNAARARLRT
jgi:hypothetical protein